MFLTKPLGAILGCFTVACNPAGLDANIVVKNHHQERRFVAIPFDTVLATHFSPRDTVLLDPSSLVADGTGIWVFDYGRLALIKLGLDGQPLWSLGRSGGGPAEFRQVRDIELAPGNAVAVLDPGTGRLTVVGPSGKVTKMIDIAFAGHAEQVAPISGGRFVLGSYSNTKPLVVIDSTGRLVDSLKVPWSDFSTLDPLSSQYLLAANPVSGVWVMGLGLGSVFSVLHELTPIVQSASYVEWAVPPTPTVSKGEDGSVTTRMPPAETARNLVVTDSSIYVLFEGHPETAGRIIDVYDARSGRYRQSLRLPGRYIDFAVHAGIFYLITNEDGPNIIGLRLRAVH